MKIDTILLENVLLGEGVQGDKLEKIMSKVKQEVQREKEDGASEKASPKKYQHFLMVDPATYEHFKLADANIFIGKVREGYDFNNLQADMDKACVEFSKTKKAKRFSIKNIADMAAQLKKKMFGEDNPNPPKFVDQEAVRVFPIATKE